MKSQVIIVQTDNRVNPLEFPFEYIELSKMANQKMCAYLGYEYIFIPMDNQLTQDKHASYGKIPVVYEFIKSRLALKESNRTSDSEIMVFLDTDAWIQDPFQLSKLLEYLEEKPEKHGCFSRDPYMKKNTYVNSGSFILKIDETSLKMYESLMAHVSETPEEWNVWPWDQIGFSKYVFENRENYLIFVTDVINSGYGKILRHCWNKYARKMRNDLYFILYSDLGGCGFEKNPVLNLDAFLDVMPYPNLEEVGYDYMDFD